MYMTMHSEHPVMHTGGSQLTLTRMLLQHKEHAKGLPEQNMSRKSTDLCDAPFLPLQDIQKLARALIQ
jgi:hypothetical protein